MVYRWEYEVKSSLDACDNCGCDESQHYDDQNDLTAPQVCHGDCGYDCDEYVNRMDSLISLGDAMYHRAKEEGPYIEGMDINEYPTQ